MYIIGWAYKKCNKKPEAEPEIINFL